MKKNNNLPLIIGLAIPVLMTVFVAISVYLPAIFTHPKGTFLYAMGGDYLSNRVYSVQDSKLVKTDPTYPATYQGVKSAPKLYVYDIEKDSNREVSLEEAQKLDLDPSNISRDGFEITSGDRDYSVFSIFFSRGDYYGSRYVRGRGVSKRLNLHKEGDHYWYQGSFQFIGWVK